MNIKELSSVYNVRYLTENDVAEVLELCKANPQYYEHCPPFVTEESIISDMKALPPMKTYDDKHYFGFYEGKTLVAVMDLIEKYPNEHTSFIGFFMVDKAYQGKGVGSGIVQEVFKELKKHYTHVRLGYINTNLQAKSFWHKNGFENTGITSKQELYTVTVAEKIL